MPRRTLLLGIISKYTESAPRSSGNFLTGVPVAFGKASGIARLISHPSEGNRLQPGDVIVATNRRFYIKLINL